MKIAQIVCTFPPYTGGIGNSAYEFAKILQRNNHEITTYTPEYQKIDEKNKEQVGKISRLKTIIKMGNGASLPQLFFHLKKYDCIYLHYPFFGTQEIIWLYRLFCKKQKFIIHYHMDTPNLSRIAKLLSLPSRITRKSLLNSADTIITSSIDYISHSDISKYYNNNKEKFIEIPFGVDIDKFKPKKEKNNKNIKLLFVGGLDKAHTFKGVDILLEAVSKLSQINWELNIIGRGEMIKNYKEKAKLLGISEKIFFWEKISNNELPKKYSESDIFILPSIARNEAFGIVLLEAMASGLPVIASDLPGVRSVFNNQAQGLKIIPNDINDLKNKLEELISNDKKRNQMSKSARELAEKKYNWETIEKKLIEIFS